MLISTGGPWTLYQSKVDHNVRFVAQDDNYEVKPVSVQHVGLTDIDDSDRLILLKLTNNELTRVCRTSHKYAALCRDNQFWGMKLEKDFPGSIRFTRDKNNFKSVYEELLKYKYKDISDAIENRNPNVLIWMIWLI